MSSEQGPRADDPPGRQGGWVGLIVILLALAAVALLAQVALKQYGLSGAAAPAKTGTPEGRAPGATGAAAALERARGVEELVKQHAEERAARDDGTAK